MTRRRVDAARLLEDGETLTFSITICMREEQGFVLRYNGRLHAYLNRCPHLQVDLDLGDERFYSAKLGRIYCKNHGALFEPDTGRCVAGPCVGATLMALRVEEAADSVWLEREPAVVFVPRGDSS